VDYNYSAYEVSSIVYLLAIFIEIIIIQDNSVKSEDSRYNQQMMQQNSKSLPSSANNLFGARLRNVGIFKVNSGCVYGSK
jgi:hypothetical protein